MMVDRWRRWWRNQIYAEFRRRFVPELSCGAGYGWFGELEETGDWGRERVKLENDRAEMVNWMVETRRVREGTLAGSIVVSCRIAIGL